MADNRGAGGGETPSGAANLEIVGIGLVVAGAAGGGLRLAGIVELDSFGTLVAAALVVIGAVVLWFRTDWQPVGIAVLSSSALIAVIAAAIFGGDAGPTVPTTNPPDAIATTAPQATTAAPATTGGVDTTEAVTTSEATTSPPTTEATTMPPPAVPPSVVAADAIAQLRSDGACLVVSHFPTFTARDGDVISTDPPAGTAYSPGDTVRVVVASNPPSETVLSIRERGTFRASFTGLIGEQQPDGTLTGFEPDLARELVARIFGDEIQIEFVLLTAAERFTAISSGSVDVLFGVFRSGELASPTRFYDDDSTRQVAIVAGDDRWFQEFDRKLGEVLSDAACRP